MLIHINGMPGVGKLTVARMLAEKFGMHLLDNHSLINAAYAAGFAHGSDGYLRTLGEISKVIYGELAANKDIRHVVMTGCLAYEYGPDPERFAKIEKLAADRQESFVPIHLSCSQDENRRRIVSPDRKSKQKLMNADMVETLHRKYTMIHPADHPHQTEIDTSDLSAEQTFAKISNHIQRFLSAPANHQFSPKDGP
jgi:cytidylate kinase